MSKSNETVPAIHGANRRARERLDRLRRSWVVGVAIGNDDGIAPERDVDPSLA